LYLGTTEQRIFLLQKKNINGTSITTAPLYASSFVVFGAFRRWNLQYSFSVSSHTPHSVLRFRLELHPNITKLFIVVTMVFLTKICYDYNAYNMSKLSEKFSDKWRSLAPKARRRIMVGGYSVAALVVAVALLFTYQSPNEALDTETIGTNKTGNNAIIDKISEVDLASAVASAARLSVQNNVSERAISVYAKSEISQTDETVITKPTLSLASGNSSLTTYTALEGDTASSIASKFSITAQTVKWANNLTNESVAAGTNLTIPVVDGVVYTVRSGDNVNDLANRYGSTASQILGQNNLDVLVPGETILIPGGVLPTNERPGYVTPRPVVSSSAWGSYSYSLSIGTTRAGNNYSYGYCTWYAYNRRVELGLPAYRSLGNANTWDDRARAAGITVSRIPRAGAIFQTDAGYYGHVGIVESVNADGTINISDMNGIAGWGRIGYANGVSPSGYWFIY